MFLKDFFLFSLLLISTSHFVYAQEDPISGLIENEFPLLFSEEASTGAIEPSLSEVISPTAPVLTPAEHKALAEEYLKKGLLSLALTHTQSMKDKDESEDYATYYDYLISLIYTQQGKFESAYTQFDKVIGFNSPFNKTAKNLQAEVALNLAWIALNQDNIDTAANWLRQYDPENETRRLENKKDYIQDAINIKKINLFSEEKPYGRPLKVALLLPLSGIYQDIGLNMLEAAQLALFQQPNPNILLYPHDTQSTEIGARLAAQKAISDKANIILGPLTASHTKAIQNYTQSAGIPVLSFSSDDTIANRYTHIFGHQKSIQAKKAAEIIADLDISTTAVLAPNDVYGQTMSQTFQQKAIALGVSVTQVVYFDPKSTDQTKELKVLAQEQIALEKLVDEKSLLEREYKIVGEAMNDASLTRLEELETLEPMPIVDFEALYLPSSAEKLPLIASQLAFYDMDSSHVQLVGSALWHNENIYKNKGEYIRGAFFPAPSNDLLTTLKGAFKQHYDKNMLPISSLAYDAVKLVTTAYVYSDYRPNRLTDEFYREDGYLLTNGPTKLLKNGLTERLYDVYEVRSYDHVSRQSTPLAFPPALPDPIDPQQKRSFDNFFNPWGF